MARRAQIGMQFNWLFERVRDWVIVPRQLLLLHGQRQLLFPSSDN